MICRIGSIVRSGPAVTAEQSIPLEPIVRAIECSEPVAITDERTVAIDCESPRAVHEHIGHIQPEMALRTRTALATAGRTRGTETPYDEEIERVESELASIAVEDCELEAHRRACVDEQQQLRQIKETVATARGRLAASREHDLGTEELEAELQAAIRRLAEAETMTTAATQNHQQARKRARAERDRRERAFRLEDRLANLRREARSWLVEELKAEFASAVRELAGNIDDPFEARPAVAAAAIAWVAEYTAPVVVEAALFESAETAHEYLGGPVIRV